VTIASSPRQLRQAQIERLDLSRFRALRAAPASLGSVAGGGSSTSLALPGRARLAIRSTGSRWSESTPRGTLCAS
jgi:hypothetical protein